MSPKALLTAALLLLIAGAVVGLIPVSSQGISCGSAFIRSSAAHVSDLTGITSDAGSTCTDLRGVVRIPAVVLLVLGGILIVGSALADSRRHRLSQS